MIRHFRTHATAAILAIFVITLMASGAAHGQRPGRGPSPVPPDKAGPATPSVVGWRDLETWTHDVGTAPDSELGLGLQLSGPEGTVATSFSVVKLRRSPTAEPKEITVTLIPAFDPNRVRWSSATFRVTTKDKGRSTIDVSDRVTTYPPGPFGPGDGPVNARVRLTPAQFVQIANADTVTGTLLNVTINFRRDQLNALKTFGERAGIRR